MFPLLADPAWQLEGEKPIFIIANKDFFDINLVLTDAALYGFLVVIISCLLSNRTTTFYDEIYSLRKTLAYKF